MEDHTITYILDGEDQTTTDKTMTPNQILSKAGIDPASHYLVELVGHDKKSYQNEPNATIHMHPKMKFISVSTAPTPVS